jgi:hypothetical protein
MGRQHDDRPLRHLGLVLHEDRAFALEVPDHVDVVDDLLADEHRRPVDAQGPLDGVDRAFDPRAVAARPGEEDPSGHAFMVDAARPTGSPPGGRVTHGGGVR